tara:strand:+ start:310 stop:573 length:264 start_codon:yes stop_codon:yes gene_type:complete
MTSAATNDPIVNFVVGEQLNGGSLVNLALIIVANVVVSMNANQHKLVIALNVGDLHYLEAHVTMALDQMVNALNISHRVAHAEVLEA